MPPVQNNQQSPKFQKSLQIMKVNVGRGGPAHDLALALAYEEGIDILLIQELWIGGDLERKLSKRHKSYTTYAPSEEWKDRPRLITHVRRQAPPLSIDKRQDILKIPDETADILVLELKRGLGKESLFVANIYNAPLGCEAPAGQ